MQGDLTTLPVVKQWLNLSGLPILSITKAFPAVVTLAARPNTPLFTGLSLGISGANGMTEVNGIEFTITTLSAISFSLDGVDSTGYGSYTDGGLAGVSDDLLLRLISAASQFAQNWMNRTIASTQYTETRNGQGGPVMLTQNYPIQSVAGVNVQGIVIAPRGPLGSTGAPSWGYTFDDISIQLTGPYGFVRGFQNVIFDYVAGFDTTPADIEQAVVDMIGEWFVVRSRIGTLSESIEGQSITYMNQSMSKRTMDILMQYKKVAPVPN